MIDHDQRIDFQHFSIFFTVILHFNVKFLSWR